MYIKRNYPLKIMLSWTWGSIIFFLCIAIVPVVLYDLFGWKWLNLPWLPIGLVGTALAFITGFKNNAAYDRAWEARQIYGGIVNSSRRLIVMMNDYITPEFAKETVTEEALFKVRKQVAHYHIAWLTALRHALRQPKLWESGLMQKTDLKLRNLYQVAEHKSTVEGDLNGYLSMEDHAFCSLVCE